jgi:hypothetical protein
MHRPRFSPALFALICVCFVLPFATVSCDGAETSFTGLQLATWTVPAGGQVSESDCSSDISAYVEDDGSAYAAIALLIAVLGLVLGLVGKAKGPGWCGAGGLIATLLIGLKGFEPLGPSVTFRVGYWLILLLFFVVICLHAAQAMRRRRAARLESAGHIPDGSTLADTDATAWRAPM